MAIPERPVLSWQRSDVEQRLGLRGGRFTRVNTLLAFLGAVVLTIIFYASLLPFDGSYFADMFTQRGPTQYATALLTFWSLMILLIKWRKIAFQRRALGLTVVPDSHDFVLSPATVDQVSRQIHEVVDDPKHFVLFNRIINALCNLRNLGRVGDVDEILRSQGEQDESIMETSYSTIQGFVWAIPVLGFIGTVLGLSEAISAFSGVLAGASDIAEISSALKGVTAGLATAFETTLAALVAALGIQLLLTGLKKREEEFLDDCSEYCSRHIVGKLRLMPFEQEV